MHRSVLPSGLRVVTEYIPGVRSASVGLWVQVGSRDEQPSVAGAAHFLEHLLFKSTPTRTAASLAEEVDAVGGELNAFTSKEHTCYYAHVLDTDVELAIDMVSDVVIRGQCLADDVEIERDVVLEEIAIRDDDAEDLAADLFLQNIFGDHPVGRPVIGTANSIESMTRTQLRSFHKRRYRPEKMVLSVAGNIEHQRVVGLARKYIPTTQSAKPVDVRRGAAKVPTTSGVNVMHRDGEQAHVLLGVPALSRFHPDRWALSVLNTVLGGGLSSRLFQEIREQRGLAYSVYSSVDTFADTGAFSVYAGCSPDRLDDVARLAIETLTDVADGSVPITDSECERARGSLRGSLVLGLEDSSSRMQRLGRSEINYHNHRSIERTIDTINSVEADDVRRVAEKLLRQPLSVTVVGPYSTPKQLPPSLHLP